MDPGATGTRADLGGLDTQALVDLMERAPTAQGQALMDLMEGPGRLDGTGANGTRTGPDGLDGQTLVDLMDRTWWT